MRGLPSPPDSLRVDTGKHKRSPREDRDRRKVRRLEDESRRHRSERDRRVDPCPSRHGTDGQRRERLTEMGRGLEERREDVRLTGDASHLQPWGRDSGSRTTSERSRHVGGHASWRRDKYGRRADDCDRYGRGGHGGSCERREDVRRTPDGSHLQPWGRDSGSRTTSERSRHARGHADGRWDKEGRADGGEMHGRGGHRGASERREDVRASGHASHLEPRARDARIRKTSERSRHLRGHADGRQVKDCRRDGSERHKKSGHRGYQSNATQVCGAEKLPSEDHYNYFNIERGRGSSWWVGGDDRQDVLPLVPRFGGLPRLAGTMRGESNTGRKSDPIELDEDGADFLPEMTSERRLGWQFTNGGDDNVGTNTSRRSDGLYLSDGDSVGGSTDLSLMYDTDQSSSYRHDSRSGISRQDRRGRSGVSPKIESIVSSGDDLDIRRRDDCDLVNVEFIGEVGISEQIRRRQKCSVVIDLVDA